MLVVPNWKALDQMLLVIKSMSVEWYGDGDGDGDGGGGEALDDESKTIVLLRIKDRLVQPAAGWCDVMINFYLKSDTQRHHVCELQIAHDLMCTARKGLPGHVVYARVRNASEILEKLELSAEGRTARSDRPPKAGPCLHSPPLLRAARSPL